MKQYFKFFLSLLFFTFYTRTTYCEEKYFTSPDLHNYNTQYMPENHAINHSQSRFQTSVHFSENTHSYGTWRPSKKFVRHATPQQILHELWKIHGNNLHANQNKILQLHSYYKYNSFIQAIKTLPQYPAYIVTLAKKLRQSQLKYFLAKRYIKEKVFNLEKEILLKEKITLQKKREEEIHTEKQNNFLSKIDSVLKNEREKLEIVCDEYKKLCDISSLNPHQQERYEKRIFEIESYLKSDSHYYERTYHLNNDTKEFVNLCNKNTRQLSHCFGNRLQQLAYQEYTNALNQYAKKHKIITIPNINNLIIDSAILGSKLASSGYIAESFSCADLCWTLVDCAQAIGEGMYDGVSNVAHILIHPIDTVENMAHTIAIIVHQIGKTLYELGAIGTNYCIEPDIGKQQWEKYCNGISQTYDVISNQLKNITAHDVIRGTTAFATETFLLTKLLSSAHKVCHAAKGNLVEFIKATESTEIIAMTAEGIPIKVATKTKNVSKSKNVSLMEERSSIARMTAKVNNMKELFELPYWSKIKKSLRKTSSSFQGKSIYEVVEKNINEYLKKGYRLYLDGLHLDHIEIFDKYGNIKAVLNLDGTFNYKKFHLALKEGRRI